jgi:hypothetical protein
MAKSDHHPNRVEAVLGTATRVAEMTEAEARAAAELDRLLDEALAETFPASDPISICLPRPKSTE